MFLESLLYTEKEKLIILIKELKQPYLISDFFSSDSVNKATAKNDLEHNFSLLKDEIELLKDRIEENYKNLNEQIYFLKNQTNKYEIQSLIYLDILREYIAYEIDNIGKINNKIAQMLRDGYNQYIPKPMLGKRFSSINITSLVEHSLKRRLNTLDNGSNSKEALILWDYTEDYRILKREKYTKFYLPFWYFELSYFLPNLTHELNHFHNNNSSLSKDLKELIDKIINKHIIKGNFNKQKPKYLSNNLAEEFLADVSAYMYHGKSYFYSLSHKLIGKNLHMFFKAINNNIYDEQYKIINTSNISIKDSFDFFSRFYFEEKKDTVFLRLYLLLELEKLLISSFKKHLNKKNYIEKFEIKYKDEIKRLLNSIYHIDEKEKIEFDNSCLSDLNSIFERSNNNDKKIYFDTKNILKDLFENIRKNFIDRNHATLVPKALKRTPHQIENSIPINCLYLQSYNKFIKIDKNKVRNRFIYANQIYRTNIDKLPYHFNKIWEERFDAIGTNHIYHRLIYRKKLHYKTIIKLIQNCYLSLDNLKPYSMVFLKYKLNKEYINNKEININDITSGGKVIGIYDYVYFRKLDEKYKLKIDNFKYDSLKDIKYYELKHSLMKIMNDTKGNIKNEGETNTIIQIEIPKKIDENNEDIYEDLFQALKEIKDIFNNKKHINKFNNIEYFKSLGPKDIIIHIDSSTIDFIYEIKKSLSEKFKRTFTTLYINKKTNTSLKSSKEYIFITKLRMHQDYKHKDFIKICETNQNIATLVHTTGSMDFKITWKNDISFDELFIFYNELIKANFVEDIQTTINKMIIGSNQ